MKVLVIGGSGFIGSHVADALTEAGHDVTIFDIKRSKYLNSRQKFVLGSIMDLEALKNVVSGHKVLYHFAGVSQIDVGLKDPLLTAQQNIIGTINILEAAKEAEIKRFVFASSIYVYSDEGGFYRCSKHAAELFIEQYQKKYDIPYTVLRYGTVYGPRSDESNSVYKYLKQALLNRHIVAKTTGKAVREYIHVEDAAQSSIAILSDDYKNEHVILTGHHRMKHDDLFEMIKEIVGSDVTIELLMVDGTNSNSADEGHYSVTPYKFSPKIAKKLVNNPYLDMGQGLLSCIEEIYSHTIHKDMMKKPDKKY